MNRHDITYSGLIEHICEMSQDETIWTFISNYNLSREYITYLINATKNMHDADSFIGDIHELEKYISKYEDEEITEHEFDVIKGYYKERLLSYEEVNTDIMKKYFLDKLKEY